jgi:hypothetical protein
MIFVDEKCIRRNLGFNSLHAFMEMDYLLVPYVEYGHSVLLGIAPKQRFVFVIDSIAQEFDSKSNTVNGPKALLLTLCPNFAYSNDPTQLKPEDWTVFGQWSLRTKTTDGSPNAAQQKDEYNCEVFTCTTAFCLAFGFDLTYYVEANLNKFKKPRMVTEFVNGGFVGPGFDYDALDLPQYRAQARSQAGPSRTQASASTSVLRSKPREAPVSANMPPQSKPGQTPAAHRSMSPRIKKMLSVRKRKQSDDDDQDQRGFGDEKEEEGSDGESDEEEALDFKKELLYTPQQLAHTLSLLPDNSTSKRNNTLPFPPQFSAMIHKQAILVYGGAPEGFNVQDRKYSKRELKQACRDFQVEGW